MAKPDLEDGYTRIANELLHALIAYPFSSRQLRVLLAVIALSYGWQRKASHISYSGLSRMTGISRRHAYNVVRKLKEDKVVFVITPNGPPFRRSNLIGVNKNYEEWISWGKVIHRGDTISPYLLKDIEAGGDSFVSSGGDT